MRAPDTAKPRIPVTYPLLLLEILAERGIPREAILDGIDLPAELLDDPTAKLSVAQYQSFVRRSLDRAGDDAGGLGYELGLRISTSAHGMLGFGVLSQLTLRNAIRFGLKFSEVVLPGYTLSYFEEDDFGVIDARDAHQMQPDLARAGYDMLLPCIWNSFLPEAKEIAPDVELWFAYPEPDYYVSYRDRLPICRFDMGANQVCIPRRLLDWRIKTGNPVSAETITQHLSRELELLGRTEDLPARVRAAITQQPDQFADLTTAASRLHLSTRTLKRKLLQEGLTFQRLLDEARQHEATRLLRDPTLSMQDIATRLGYTEAENFIRAFKRWNGQTPAAARQAHVTPDPAR